MSQTVSISVVSHGQAALVESLLADIDRVCAGPIEIILTRNIPEELPRGVSACRFPVIVIDNAAPKGFGANHNQAFARAGGAWFCVVNPDIRLDADPFPALLGIAAAADVGVAAPIVKAPSGAIEDSARRFPTPSIILAKTLGRRDRVAGRPGEPAFFPDWVAGMFMLFRRETFAAIGGFDDRYFMYYEDVDLCARLRLAGKRAAVAQAVAVTHDARRASHRSLRHLAWHLRSMARFFASRVFREVTLDTSAGR